MSLTLPATIYTERLLLRSWKPSDARSLKSAIDANLQHLQAWMPWAMSEPSPIEEIVARIEKFAADFAAGVDWTYGIFSSNGDTVIGGSGAHPRIGSDGLEIGYWIGTAHTHQGYATEAAAAITRAAFTQPTIQQIQIRCDTNNVASAAIPRRLGYHHIETLVADATTPAGAPRDTMVWQLTRTEFESQGV